MFGIKLHPYADSQTMLVPKESIEGARVKHLLSVLLDKGLALDHNLFYYITWLSILSYGLGLPKICFWGLFRNNPTIQILGVTVEMLRYRYLQCSGY